uniref:Lipase domain-containing protein n=1 Tax=Graphocephala atropunctata TaxID=36148 RepID=A0A1B6KRY5_9HEMI
MWNNSSLFCIILVTFTLELTVSKVVQVGPCALVVDEPGDCPDPDYIKVYLFTRKNREEGQYVQLTASSDNMTTSHFDPRRPNKLIIHGYNSDMLMYALQDIKAEYLQRERANVWMVDYPKLAQGSSLCYPFAVHNIRHVGACLAQLVSALRRHNKSAGVHVVGFSLGAHVANYMATTLGSTRIDRITGLDPAGPLFMTRSERHRLDPGDANFVDVVHTNGLIQGIIERCGHIDFYMNGGVSQPGCYNNTNPFACDHHRAPEYFAESIRTKVGFFGWQCEGYLNFITGECKPKLNLVPMGEKCESGDQGFYVAYTAAEKPFALGNWTDKSYWVRAPKTSFNKKPKNITDELILNQQRELLERIFPGVLLQNPRL